ncbi:MAG: FAD-binding oxidoreductase [Acidimicrobiia bacterium]|nr:FAD-binding oxidoreductase [Acidimicrobiia bacterium]
MSSLRSALPAVLRAAAEVEVPGAPEVELLVAPTSLDDAAAFLSFASERGLLVLPWGGGTHQGFGARPEADAVLATTRIADVVAWEPEDMTLVVQAGALVSDIEAKLAERGQTAVLPERTTGSTIGGVVAAGVSGWRRARYGPTRDRMLEVSMVTGDGRIVRGGGRVVKNVTGFDLPRLAAGSLGALGLIGQVCLKLWPTPSAQVTVEVDDATRAWSVAYRPLAVLEINGRALAFLAGTPAEVEGQAEALGGEAFAGLDWPEPLEAGTGVLVSVRVPPADVRAAVDALPDGSTYIAAFGVGEVVARLEDPSDIDGLTRLRGWAEERRGALVVVEGPDEVYATFDPWGTPPQSLDIQRRLIARFDPDRILNRGRLPGGI